MIVLNSGIPRSGTVLTNSIIKKLMNSKKLGIRSFNPGPKKVAHLLSRINEEGLAAWANFVIHNHDWFPEMAKHLTDAGDNVRVIANYRDPRDVCVSLKKLHDLPLEDAIKLTINSTSMHLKLIKDMSPLHLKYEEVSQDPVALVHTLADYLGFGVSEEDAQRIAEETSVKKHKKIMEEVASGSDNRDIRSFENTRRVFHEDKNTHISDRHIQSGQPGRWLTELNEEEQRLVRNKLGKAASILGYK